MPGERVRASRRRRSTPSGAALAPGRASARDCEIAHGLAEHSARYARLAAALNAAGLGVYAADLRGHGPKAATADLGHFADEDGWAKCVGRPLEPEPPDRRRAAGRSNRLPRPFAGLVPRAQFVGEHSDALAGAAYSGSNGKPPPIATLGRLIARAERLRLGKRGKSRLIFKMWFGEFNKPFKPARTDFDWLSRDEKEVAAYVADPLCGFPFTTQLAIDVLDALPSLSSPQSLAAVAQGPADLRLLRRARPGWRQHPGPYRRPQVGGLQEAHDPHLSGRAPRDAQRDQPGRGRRATSSPGWTGSRARDPCAAGPKPWGSHGDLIVVEALGRTGRLTASAGQRMARAAASRPPRCGQGGPVAFFGAMNHGGHKPLDRIPHRDRDLHGDRVGCGGPEAGVGDGSARFAPQASQMTAVATRSPRAGAGSLPV